MDEKYCRGEEITYMFKDKLMPYILLAPLAVLFVLPMLLSIFILVVQSLGYIPALGLNSITLKYFFSVLKDRTFLDSLIFSMQTAVISTVLTIILGFIAAYALSKTKEEALVQKLVRLPLLIPHFTAAFLVFLMFSQSGGLSRVMGTMGLLHGQEAFPQMVFDSMGMGIIITYVWKEVPFAALVLYATMKTIGAKFYDSAYNLGASELQYIMNVLVPLTLPSILSTFSILFAFNFGAFEVPFLIGPSYPKALPVLGYISYLSPDLKNRPETMAVNILITVICLLALYAYSKAVKAMADMKNII
ncbi:MAG TPA: ABC transporter permease subunit [Clostridia bacterium]|nr:ABC transporter permease subunit [Clostridia bacterium]